MSRAGQHPWRAAALAALILGGCAGSSGRAGGTADGNATVLEKGIVYAAPDGAELRLDIARPARGGRYPAVIFLYGGGYAQGSRGAWAPELRLAAERGYVAVAIDYRLTNVLEEGRPKHTFPAQLHDAKCAVRWLRANAGKYALDPERIGVVGFSAGGNLALMLGLTGPADGLEGECGDPGLSSRVQAVVNLAGGVDLAMQHRLYAAYMERYLGGGPEQVPDRYRAASPLTYVDGNDPPVLTLCGTRDGSLPEQMLLEERMQQAGAEHTLLVVEGAGHNQYALVDFPRDNPLWSFLQAHLKGGR
jgi:acetyl esterase/lipase